MLQRRDSSIIFRLLLKPLVRFCLAKGGRIQELVECLKLEMISVSQEMLAKQGHEVTLSKMSVMTGIHRKEVERLRLGETRIESEPDFVGRVIGQWQGDPACRLRSGKPKELTYGFDKSEFNQLVRKVRTDINPASVLFELERIGAVRRNEETVSLIAEMYVPVGDLISGYALMGKELDDSIQSIQENIEGRLEIPNLHIRTEYDRVRDSSLEMLRKTILSEGHKFHRDIRELVAAEDQDVSPRPSSNSSEVKTARVVITTYARIDNSG